MMFLLGSVIVFSWILQVRFTEDGDTGEFALYLLAGLPPWLSFQEGVLGATGSLVENASLVKGVSFPPAMLVTGRVLSNAVSLLIGLTVFVFVLALTGRGSWHALLILPLLILLQVAFTLGVGLLMASMYTYVRDTMPVLQIAMIMWLFLTPIFYPVSHVPQQLLPLYLCNPIQSFVMAYRAVLLKGVMPSAGAIGLACAWAVGTLLLGTTVFARVEPGFADVV